MLRKMKCLDIEKYNIVKFIDTFPTQFGNAVVFEALDISLYDYLDRTNCEPMLLSDIRAIIKQLATALDALKKSGIIHTDVKCDNIMMVNHQLRPLKVKLIDFGVAISTSHARQGMRLQPLSLRSPEIICGLKFSEAIDMWSLGCVMALMILGNRLFEAPSEYELLRRIVELLGQPADHLLNGGLKTKDYFNWTESNCWELKTPAEFYGRNVRRVDEGSWFQSVDDLKDVLKETNNEAEAEDCIELLKAMLKIDPNERITPREVASHPFITKDYPTFQTVEVKTPRSSGFPSPNEGFDCEPPVTPLKDEDSSNIHPDDSNPSPEILSSGPEAESTMLYEDQSPIRFESELSKTSKPSVMHADSSTSPLISEDSEDRGRRKNRFRCFFSWMKKTFCCCCVTNVDVD
ncbi:homeodomain-interacting protein kinase 2-like isoform X2 [Sparus aurata]|nr:homeodomain-interacting protein kinase 2-like isoform X2 [Sparus aurata]